MTWGIWEIFTRALSSGLSRDQCISLKFTGEICVMTMKRDAKFEKELTCKFKIGMRNLLKIGMRNLLNFDQSTQKISKIYTLMDCFWPKYIMFELKKYKRVMFDGTEDWCKFEGKLTCSSKNYMTNLANFYQSTQKSQNWNFQGIFFFPNLENVWGGVMCHTMKNDAKFEEEFSYKFKIGMRNLLIFDPSTQKISNICTLMGCFWPKYIMFELRKYIGVMFDGTGNWCKIWRKIDLCFLKWHEEFGEFSFTGWKIAI